MTKNIEPKNNSYLLQRIIAGIIDYLIIFILFAVLIYFFGVPDGDGGYSLNGLPALSVLLIWFVFTVGAEQLFGSTIGNLFSNLKPVSLKDSDIDKITFSQSFKRHLLDVIDMSFFGFIGIILIKSTDKNQRLGDIWAKTTVVKFNQD